MTMMTPSAMLDLLEHPGLAVDDLHGETLKLPISEAEARALVTKLLKALETAHRLGLAHGAIAPEVVVRVKGQPILERFGAVAGGSPQHDVVCMALLLAECVAGPGWARLNAPQLARVAMIHRVELNVPEHPEVERIVHAALAGAYPTARALRAVLEPEPVAEPSRDVVVCARCHQHLSPAEVQEPTCSTHPGEKETGYESERGWFGDSYEYWTCCKERVGKSLGCQPAPHQIPAADA